MKRIISLLICIVFLAGTVSAAEIGYVLKNTALPNQDFIRVIDNLEYNYTLIDDSDVSKTDFSKFKMILVGENIKNVPVDSYPALIVSPDYSDFWSLSTGSTTPSQPVSAFNINSETRITQNHIGKFQVYTTARKQLFYLTGTKKPGVVSVTNMGSSNSDSGKYVIALKRDPRRVFFGITETDFWTQESERLFKDSIVWIIEGEDRDGDGYLGGVDCNDKDIKVHPGAIETAYDGIDQDCNGGDLADVDQDGYCKEGETITNKNIQCNKETSSTGTDCRDNDFSYNIGSDDSLKNCLNEAPVYSGGLNQVLWNEDQNLTIDLNDFFSDPDNDELTYSIDSYSNEDGIIVDITGTKAFFNSLKDWFGQGWIKFIARDENGLTKKTESITLTVNPVNDAPVLNEIGDIYALAGETIQINPSATDAENSQLIFLYGLPLNSTGAWETSEETFGDYQTIVIVSDGELIDEQEINIFVRQKIYINEISSGWIELYNPRELDFSLENCKLKTTDQEVNLNGKLEGKKFVSFNIASNESDKAELKCNNVVVDSISFGTFNDGNLGDNAPELSSGKSIGRKSDGINTGNNMNDFKVYDTPTRDVFNDADMIIPEVELISPANNANFNLRDIQFSFKASDNSNSLNCELFSDINGEFNSLGQLTVLNGTTNNITINGVNDGNYLWNVRCYDESHYSFADSNRTFSINAPDSPILNPIGSKTVDEGKLINFMVSGSHPENKDIEFRALNLPSGAIFNSGTFSWTPGFDQSGDYSITFEAEDSDGLKDSEIVKISVNNIPTFEKIGKCTNLSSKLDIKIKNPDDNDEIIIGEDIKVKVELQNDFNEDVEGDLSVYLYDLKNEKIIDDEKESVDIDKRDDAEEEFTLEFDSDAEKDIIIFAKFESDDNQICNEEYFELDVEREKHKVVIDDIKTVDSALPGEEVEVKVRLQNEGKEDEEAYVEIISESLEINEKTEEFDIEQYGDDDKVTKTFNVRIPENVSSGDYEITARVIYNGEEDSEIVKLSITEAEIPIVKEEPKATETVNNVIDIKKTVNTIKETLKIKKETPSNVISIKEEKASNVPSKNSYSKISESEKRTSLIVVCIALLVGILIIALGIKKVRYSRKPLRVYH